MATTKGFWSATDSLLNRKQTYYFVIALAVVFSFSAVTMGVVGGRSKESNSKTLVETELSGEPTESPFITPDVPLLTSIPSLRPSLVPTMLPTTSPSANTTLNDWDFNFTLFPSNVSSSSPIPSDAPSFSPTVLPQEPSRLPTAGPSESPTLGPSTRSPIGRSSAPTVERDGRAPSSVPTDYPLADLDTRFYAIGDVPYSIFEAAELKTQIFELEKDAEFVIHVGDIRTAKTKNNCTIEEYRAVADILNKSHAPVFIVLGGKTINMTCANSTDRLLTAKQPSNM